MMSNEDAKHASRKNDKHIRDKLKLWEKTEIFCARNCML